MPQNPLHPQRSQSQRERDDLETALQHQHALNHQLSRLIWQLVNVQPEGIITIDESKIDPLWELDYKRRDPAKQTEVTISAIRMSEATDDQIERLAARLLGQSKHPADDMLAVGLGDYPFSYISRKLAPHIILHEGTWIARAEYDKINPPAP